MRRRADRLYRHPPPKLRHVPLEDRGAGPVVHELTVAPRLDQPGARQFLEMVRDGRLAHRETTAEPLAADLALPRDVLQDLEASRVGQRFRDSLELLGFQGPPRS